MNSRLTSGLLTLPALLVTPIAASQEDKVDFSDQITQTCELIGLVGLPPAGWFNVPIESPLDTLVGCQMMRVNEREELVGILRLLSTVVSAGTPEETWAPELIGLEISWLETMGINLGEPMWKRDDVRVAGPGFENGKAIGLEATVEDSDIPQEVQFLTFGSPTTKYLVTLSTPGRSVEDGVYYQRNTSDFGILIRTLQPPRAE